MNIVQVYKLGQGGDVTCLSEPTAPSRFTRDGFTIGVGNDGLEGLGVEELLGGGLEVGAEVGVGDVY